MNETARPLTGIIPILSMPFRDDDAIDDAALAAQAAFLLKAGADGVGFGFGSEIYRLTDAERDDALKAVTTSLAPGSCIVVATGANSTRATVERSLAARHAGATHLMVTPPGFSVISPDQVFDHYQTLAREVDLPIIVQDAPSMTGVMMSNQLLGRLAHEIDQVVAVKIEVSPPAPKISGAVASIGDAASVLGGAGGIDFVHELERGAVGTIPGSGLPELFIAVWKTFHAGDRATARAIFNRHLPLLNLCTRSLDTFLWVQKEFLRRRGILPNARLRQPTEQMDERFIAEFNAMLSDLGLGEMSPGWDGTGHFGLSVA